MEHNELKGKKGFKRILNAAGYSADGLQAAFRYEADFDLSVRMVLVFASFFSLVVELFNSAIEAVVDDISLELRPLAKRAKDIGSAAQMLALTLVFILWLMALCGG